MNELKTEVDEIKKTADTAYDNSETNRDEIDKLKGPLFSADGSSKALHATCNSLHDYRVQ